MWTKAKEQTNINCLKQYRDIVIEIEVMKDQLKMIQT